MSTLSICVIAKNEEDIIGKSLSSVKNFADEIIVVDTGSTDNTVSIAKEFTDKVFNFKWIDDFSAAHNSSADKATMDYIFRWDADFIATDEAIDSIKSLKKLNFKNSNLISGLWNNIDSKTGLPYGNIRRNFIYKRGEFKSVSPIHSTISNLPGVKTKPLYEPELIINHYKDRVTKQFRYDQSFEIIKKALKNDPKNQHLRFHFILALVINHDFTKALTEINKYLDEWPDDIPSRTLLILEKKLACLVRMGEPDQIALLLDKYTKLSKYPQFQLLEADVFAVLGDSEAVNKYTEFLNHNYQISDFAGHYNYSRYKLHPLKVLAQIDSNKNREAWQSKLLRASKKYASSY